MWLNTVAYSNFELALCLIGSALWVAVYVEIIRNVHRNRFLEMPVFVVAGNFVWEGLYSWFYADYINLGDLLLWGYRAWFVLDIYIVWLAIRFGYRQFENPFLRKHTKAIFFGLMAGYLILNWATIESGIDNMPIDGDGSVKLGGISAYVLNVIISFGYIYIYVRHRRITGFSILTAWMKGIGTLCFSVFFAMNDPHNYLLLSMAVIVAVLDGGYIYIRHRYPSLTVTKTISVKPKFEVNPVFEKLWEENPSARSYFEMAGLRLRQLSFDRWICKTDDYHSPYTVLESNVIYQVSSGNSSSENILKTVGVLREIIRELELQGKDVFLFCNAMNSSPGDFDARTVTVEFFAEAAHKNLRMFVVAPRIIRAAMKIGMSINPEVLSNIQAFSDDHSCFVATIHALTHKRSLSHNQDIRFIETDSNTRLRLRQIFSALDKIARNKVESVEKIEIDDDDPFNEIFDALDLVMADKQLQMKSLHSANQELQEQSAVIEYERARSESLLLNVLPESVALRLKNGEKTIADYFPSVSILFADIEGFTPLSADMPAYVVVRFLNHVFSEFDRIIKSHGCEKIKTIGDGYMAVAGAPVMCEDHAERLARAALDMQRPIVLPEEIQNFIPKGKEIGIRIGIHTGSVVAGVVGEQRFVYDVYSDAVNIASRMESHGEINKIHVTSEFMRHVLNRFASVNDSDHGMKFEGRGDIEIKGKGMMRTFFLERA